MSAGAEDQNAKVDSDCVMIVAAEASSALFAQRLMEHWKSAGRELNFFGVGTREMESLGLERLGRSEEMAVVGAQEIIEQWDLLKCVFNSLVEAATQRRPKLAIVLDYPEFNLMLAKKLHALGIPVVYYVSPQVWAWRKGRVKTIKKYCRKVLLLFPFEVPFYQEKGVPYDFVGHPILDEIQEKYYDPSARKVSRNRRGIMDDEIVIGLMPGSRRGEIKRHFDIQIEVARRLYKNFPKIRVLLMVAPTLEKAALQELMDDVAFPIMVIKDEPFEMINLADFVLAASGTATLMVGLLEKPMVVMYRMTTMTGLIARLVVRGVKFFGIVNLIMNREVVPERWQGGATADKLYPLMSRFLQDSDYTAKVRADLKTLRLQLGDKGATARVAQSLEEYLK
jgi:lipid-A-disaccharide synthase